MIIIGLLLLLIFFVFVGVDLGLSIYEWQSRIHIGRWRNRDEWQKAIKKRATEWINHSPTIKITDNNRWVLYDIIVGKYRSKTIQSWQDAGLLFAAEREEVIKYVQTKFDAKTGNWKEKPKHIDAALLAYVIKSHGLLPLQAEKEILDLLLKLKSEMKTIPYRRSLPDIRFVDTIGMTTPFLMLCGEDKMANDQIKEYDKAKLPNSSIPSHAFNINYNLPMGVYDWSRGIGWYILGLIESNKDGKYNDRIVLLAEELLKFQRNDGGFGSMIFNKYSNYESSGTALIGLLMLRSYEVSKNKTFLDSAFNIEQKLITSTRRTGELDYCQGDTKGIGYYSHTFSIMPFAQGIALKLSKELNPYANR